MHPVCRPDAGCASQTAPKGFAGIPCLRFAPLLPYFYFDFFFFAVFAARFLVTADDECAFLVGALARRAFFADFRFNALRTVFFVADAKFFMGFDSAISPAFAPAIPPTTAPTAAPRGPINEPAAAPAAAPPAICKPDLALDFLPVVFTCIS